MFDALQSFTESLRGKINLMIGRAVLSAIRDTGAIQTAQAQILADEIHDDVERVQEYGFSSVPIPGAEAVIVFQGGNRDHGLIIATDDRRYRLKNLENGEVALYTDEGDSIVFRRGKIIEIQTDTLKIEAGAKVSITCPVFEATASSFSVTASAALVDTPLFAVTGQVQDLSGAGGPTMSAMREIFNTHTHRETNTSGGSTQKPTQEM